MSVALGQSQSVRKLQALMSFDVWGGRGRVGGAEGTYQNSLFVALAHVNRASTAARTVAAFTENRQGSTASMNAATCGTPGSPCPNSDVCASVGV